MRALSGTGPAGDFFMAELFVWATAVVSDRASTHKGTARSRVSLGFGISFNIRFLRESGPDFRTHSRKEQRNGMARRLTTDEPALPSSNSSNHDERFLPGRDGVGQRRVGRLVRQVFLAGEEAQKRSALSRGVIANGPTQHRIASLKRIEDRSLRDWMFDVEFHIAANVRQGSKMRRKDDTDHDVLSTIRNHPSVCTSTESTAGRSRTIGAQLSPASADA